MITKGFRDLLNSLVRLLTVTDTTLAEFWGSTMLILMGVWLLLPMDTFRSIPAYRVMDSVAPEATWGLAAIAVGGFQAFGNLSRSLPSRSHSAFVASVMFGFVAVLAIRSSSESLLAPICGTASFIEGVIYLRLAFLKVESPSGGS